MFCLFCIHSQPKCVLCCFAGVQSAFTVTYPVAGLTQRTLRFTQVITNIGGDYNISSGLFTCQFPGVYVFALHIMKNSGTDSADCQIRKNRSRLVIAHSNPEGDSETGYFSSTNSVVVHLVRRDVVDVGSCSSFNSIFTSNTLTSFSGFLLKAD